MPQIKTFFYTITEHLNKTQVANFLVLLLIRIYLAPIFILAGWGKLTALENTAYYFGEYLGLPLPMFMALSAGLIEFVGGFALLLGFATRLMALPLMVTMLVAAFTAHWQYGWHALPESTLTVPWEWRTDLIEEAQARKSRATAILQEHGNYEWLTGAGNFTVLKNGIEFAATYFVMLMVLFFYGAGRWVSLDYWCNRGLRGKVDQINTNAE
ncbi:Inner membrane protein YqjF [Thalassocella blandensis]|nr:Inner membrane protein YqjF [Thalassocella blandensis]